jgi:hypothetical protein
MFGLRVLDAEILRVAWVLLARLFAMPEMVRLSQVRVIHLILEASCAASGALS